MLSPEEIAALRATQDWLRSAEGAAHFHMNYFYMEDIQNINPRFPGQCGTVMCIGGYLEQICPEIFANVSEDCAKIYDKLVLPDEITNYDNATPLQAILAIETFITTDGEAAWSKE